MSGITHDIYLDCKYTFISINNSKYFYANNEFHRKNGPAIEDDYGKEWWLNGVRHRKDGPAVEYANSTKIWYQNGYTHREDGPAVIWHNGHKEWWLNGKIYSETEFNEKQFNGLNSGANKI